MKEYYKILEILKIKFVPGVAKWAEFHDP